MAEDLQIEESDRMAGRPDGLRHALQAKRLEP
jgi:hypothetical protein